jgi:hypothetical protein
MLFFNKKQKKYLVVENYDNKDDLIKIVEERYLKYEINKSNVRVFELDYSKLKEVYLEFNIRNNLN